MASFSRTICVSQYQKDKSSLDLNEARGDGVWGWQWHQLDHVQTICTSRQTDNHNNQLLQARCYSWRLTNSVKALKHKGMGTYCKTLHMLFISRVKQNWKITGQEYWPTLTGTDIENLRLTHH